MCSEPHWQSMSRTGMSVFPEAVSEYSTFGGTWA